jgi:8-oxo-dGTP pyrophosphatase MutT (NUDIX family)
MRNMTNPAREAIYDSAWIAERLGATETKVLQPHAQSQADLIAAAVLLPLVPRPKGMTVLLTRRAEDLADHAGQVSFPGGRIEAGDASIEDAALREAEEEIGLSRNRIETLGHLPARETGTGFLVFPIVGLVRPPFDFNPDPREVAEIFEVPLSIVLDPARHERVEKRSASTGRIGRYHAIRHEGHFIWGTTAAMLVSFYELMRQP